MTILVHQYNLF